MSVVSANAGKDLVVIAWLALESEVNLVERVCICAFFNRYVVDSGWLWKGCGGGGIIISILNRERVGATPSTFSPTL